MSNKTKTLIFAAVAIAAAVYFYKQNKKKVTA
jgi:hypothetical protein